MELFPNVLIRVSGGPFQGLEKLNLTESARIAKEIFQLQGQLSEIKKDLSDQLYQFIPQVEDPQVQNALLKCRRDIFNQRDISPETLDTVIQHLPSPLNEKIKQYLRVKKSYRNLFPEGEDIFATEVHEARQHLHGLVMDELFQKGLILSSQSLFKQIPSYISRSKDKKVDLNKKDSQTERGLIKYISRMYSKTSPFSTFTQLVMGKSNPDKDWTEQPKSLLSLPSDKARQIVCHIRLNNYLYSYLHILMCRNPEIYRHFLIRPNPTLSQEENHYLFLTNNNNIEAFQRIPINPVLDVFRHLCGERKEGKMLRELVQDILANEYIDAPAEELIEYIYQLIQYGFLEFNIGVSGIDPDWDIKLCCVLEQINRESDTGPLPLLEELIGTLKHLRSQALLYGQSPCSQRLTILQEVYDHFKSTCMKLHEAAGLPEIERLSPDEQRKLRQEQSKKQQEQEAPETDSQEEKHDTDSEDGEKEEEVFKHQSSTAFYFKPEQMFYEDTTVDVVPQLNETELNAFTSELHQLLQQMKPFRGHQDEHDKMNQFFLSHYGKEATLPLMTFYEQYYRIFKKPEAEWSRKPNKEGMPDALIGPAIDERQKKNRTWLEQVIQEVRPKEAGNSGLISIHLEQLRQATKNLPKEPTPSPSLQKFPRSYGSFVQFYRENNKIKGVLNSSFSGFGKLFSRFLHIFDAQETNHIRSWNLKGQIDTLLLEDCDASYFNANLHPPLMPYEVRIPGGHNNLSSQYQIPITELLVKYNPGENQLMLLEKTTGKRVFVFDLGFQGHGGRSQLFQLLEKFSLAEYLFCNHMVNALLHAGRPLPTNQSDTQPEAIRIHPRVVFADRIVLSRKTWFIPQHALPFRSPGENTWAYFVRVNTWRRELGIPDEIFVHVVDPFQSQRAEAKPAAKEKAVNPEQNQENEQDQERDKEKNASPENENQKPRQAITRDDYKPQYINLNNPFLIQLFEKLLKRVPESLKIVEMLPNSQQLMEFGQNRHITEFTLQWYTFPPETDNATQSHPGEGES